MLLKLVGLLVSVVLATAAPIQDYEDVKFRMPNVQPTKNDTYLCLPMKMGEQPKYITNFQTFANMSRAHHVLLYGCEEPGNAKEVWNCGEMASSAPGMDNKPVCAQGSKIIYAWAMDAPALSLPKDVGFKVGGKTDIKWLVLQVHYKDVRDFLPPKSEKDKSGITMRWTNKPQKKTAGVYLLMTGGAIPAHSTVYMEAACTYNEKIPLHPFAYRVHAHVHGEVVTGYRVRGDKWTEIGRVSPKKPQMFYNVTNPGLDVEDGDVLAARCTMVNNEGREVDIGATQQDEMCNFYIMYWVDGDTTPQENMCITDGPPTWSWADFMGLDLSGIPKSVSMIPGTKKIIEATKTFMNDGARLLEKYMDMMKLGAGDALPVDFQRSPWEPEPPIRGYQDFEEDDLYEPFLGRDDQAVDMRPDWLQE